MGIEVADTVKGLSALGLKIDAALYEIARSAAETIQTEVRRATPIGTPGNSSNPPGALAASILIAGPFGSGHEYYAHLGPTLIYGRQRELGGDITVKYAPYLVFQKFGVWYKRLTVHQEPDRYMWRGLLASIPHVEAESRVIVETAIMS